MRQGEQEEECGAEAERRFNVTGREGTGEEKEKRRGMYPPQTPKSREAGQ